MALATNRADATTSATNHAADHNAVNAKVNALHPARAHLLASGFVLTNELTASTLSSLAMTGNNTSPGNNCLVPIVVPTTLTFSGLGCGLNASANTTFRMGIYNSGADNVPATKLTETTVNLTSTSPVVGTISQTLDAGLYWVAIQQAGGGTGTLRAVDKENALHIGWRNVSSVGTSSSGALHLDYSYNTGLPDSLNATYMQVTIWYDTTQVPRVLLQIA